MACVGAPGDGSPASAEPVAATAEAIGESTCATVNGLHGVRYTPWSGSASDGAAVAYAANATMYATSPSATYGETGCTNAFITSIYAVNDFPGGENQRRVYGQPATMPTTEVRCETVVQEAAVYTHTTGNPWTEWTQVGGAGMVYQWGATWTGSSCQMIPTTVPNLPLTGIDEIRVAGASNVRLALAPTQGGVYETINPG